ncbi:MAG: hypothetical protein ABDH28_02570 [Brevinematia bacterium]
MENLKSSFYEELKPNDIKRNFTYDKGEKLPPTPTDKPLNQNKILSFGLEIPKPRIAKTIFLIIFLSICLAKIPADTKNFKFKPINKRLKFVEDFFQIYNEWLYQDLDSISRNIYFLELAWSLPFDHPIRALTPISNETHWQRYKLLIKTHIALLLTKNYLDFGKQFYKENIYFYSKEYEKELLEGYDIAEKYFKSALGWFGVAKKYAKMVSVYDPQIYATTLHHMEDEYRKLLNGEIYYDVTVKRLLKKIAQNREKLKMLKDFEWVEPIP